MLHHYNRTHFMILILFIIYFVSVPTASAEDFPTTGLLYNTQETHSLVYFCSKTSGGLLECNFIQTAIRNKEKPKDLKASLDQARAEFRKGVQFSAEECKSYSTLLDIFEGRQKPPKGQDKIDSISDVAKRDIISSLKAMTRFCKNKTEDNYLKIIQLTHDKNMRTCQVSSIPYKQTFSFIKDKVSGTGAWVARGEPAGPCGVVQLSRFEPEQPKGIPIVFWKYVARKAITNPKGEIVPGASCKELDESEYLYDWRAKEHQLSCDYIEFSAM